MKKILVCTFALLFILVVGTASKVEAYPYIEVTGTVSTLPGFTYSDDSGSAVGTNDLVTLDVLYSFRVDTADAGAEMNKVNLEFEGDVFKSLNTVFGYNPSDWTSVGTITSSAGNIYEISGAGSTIGLGGSFSFTANVTMYTAALSDGSMWDEGGLWEQSFHAFDTLYGVDGGSTNPVPEPGTIALLGIGLAGLVGVGARRRAKNKAA